jgi:hypothetical protein
MLSFRHFEPVSIRIIVSSKLLKEVIFVEVLFEQVRLGELKGGNRFPIYIDVRQSSFRGYPVWVLNVYSLIVQLNRVKVKHKKAAITEARSSGSASGRQ